MPNLFLFGFFFLFSFLYDNDIAIRCIYNSSLTFFKEVWGLGNLETGAAKSIAELAACLKRSGKPAQVSSLTV